MHGGTGYGGGCEFNPIHGGPDSTDAPFIWLGSGMEPIGGCGVWTISFSSQKMSGLIHVIILSVL